jgi:hypothetical protein
LGTIFRLNEGAATISRFAGRCGTVAKWRRRTTAADAPSIAVESVEAEDKHEIRQTSERFMETTYILSAMYISGLMIRAMFFMKAEININTLALRETIFQSSISRPNPPKPSTINDDGPIFLSNSRDSWKSDQYLTRKMPPLR